MILLNTGNINPNKHKADYVIPTPSQSCGEQQQLTPSCLPSVFLSVRSSVCSHKTPRLSTKSFRAVSYPYLCLPALADFCHKMTKMAHFT
jgi:hypothetical protein